MSDLKDFQRKLFLISTTVNLSSYFPAMYVMHRGEQRKEKRSRYPMSTWGNLFSWEFHTVGDEAGRNEGIPLAFMSYAKQRVERLVLAIPPAKHSQTLSCSGIIRTCCRCLKYYLTERNTASPANSPSWLDLDSVPLPINGELPALKASTGAVYRTKRSKGGVLGVGFDPPSGSAEWEPYFSHEIGSGWSAWALQSGSSRRKCSLITDMNSIH